MAPVLAGHLGWAPDSEEPAPLALPLPPLLTPLCLPPGPPLAPWPTPLALAQCLTLTITPLLSCAWCATSPLAL